MLCARSGHGARPRQSRFDEDRRRHAHTPRSRQPGTYYVRVRGANNCDDQRTVQRSGRHNRGATAPGAPVLTHADGQRPHREPVVVPGQRQCAHRLHVDAPAPRPAALRLPPSPLSGTSASFPGVPSGIYYLRLTAIECRGHESAVGAGDAERALARRGRVAGARPTAPAHAVASSGRCGRSRTRRPARRDADVAHEAAVISAFETHCWRAEPKTAEEVALSNHPNTTRLAIFRPAPTHGERHR